MKPQENKKHHITIKCSSTGVWNRLTKQPSGFCIPFWAQKPHSLQSAALCLWLTSVVGWVLMPRSSVWVGLCFMQNKSLLPADTIISKPKYTFYLQNQIQNKSGRCHVSSNLYILPMLDKLLWDFFKFRYFHIHFVYETTAKNKLFPLTITPTVQPSERKSIHSQFFVAIFLHTGEETV